MSLKSFKFSLLWNYFRLIELEKTNLIGNRKLLCFNLTFWSKWWSHGVVADLQHLHTDWFPIKAHFHYDIMPDIGLNLSCKKQRTNYGTMTARPPMSNQNRKVHRFPWSLSRGGKMEITLEILHCKRQKKRRRLGRKVIKFKMKQERRRTTTRWRVPVLCRNLVSDWRVFSLTSGTWDGSDLPISELQTFNVPFSIIETGISRPNRIGFDLIHRVDFLLWTVAWCLALAMLVNLSVSPLRCSVTLTSITKKYTFLRIFSVWRISSSFRRPICFFRN